MFVDHHHHPQFQHIMIPSPQCIYVPLSVKDVCPPLPVYKKCLSPGGHTGGGNISTGKGEKQFSPTGVGTEILSGETDIFGLRGGGANIFRKIGGRQIF